MYQLSDLLHLMARLRDPQYGCPWDLQQDYASIVPHTIEEAYEVADAIEQGDFEHLPGELGDLLFQVVYYSQLGQEEGRFDFASWSMRSPASWSGATRTCSPTATSTVRRTSRG